MNKKKKRSIEAYMCFSLLVIMTIVLFVNVIARYVFNASLSWSEELSRYMFVWFIFVSASYAVTQRAHIRVEALNNLIPTRIRPYINLIGKIVWLSFSLFVTYIGVQYALSVTISVSAAMSLPMYIVYFGIPVGYFLISFRLFVQIIAGFKKPELEINESNEEMIGRE